MTRYSWSSRTGIWVLLVVVTLVASACTPSTSNPPNETTTTTTTIDDGGVSTTAAAIKVPNTQPLDIFNSETGEELLRRNPELVTELGLEGLLGLDNTQLNDLSFAHRSETAAIAEAALVNLDRYPVDELDADDAVAASILRWFLEDVIALSAFPDHEYAVNYITGAHTALPEFLADIHPINDIEGARAYIARLRAAGDQMRQVADNLTRSEDAGILPTTTGLQIAGFQIDEVLQPEADHPLVSDLMDRVAEIESITDEEAAVLREDAENALAEGLLPGYRNLQDTVNGTGARSETTPGVTVLPEGKEYYAAILRHYVSSDITPEDAHQLGLTNVERLTEEITPVVHELGYNPEELGFGRAVADATGDAGFFPLTDEASRAEVLALATQQVDDAEQTFASMFETFPETPLEVVRPRPGREGGAGAYYIPPPVDGSRPGLFYLSLGGQGLGKQTFTTTNYHEAIPGHHFQLALQRESEDLPLLQRAMTLSGFAEGWGLYAERLAFEAGLYDNDPQGNLGRLRMELLRAARVVADTGIHDLGWSRDEAITYLTDLGFSRGHASSEVDRYIVWPGQAPSYLIGMLKILRLRDEAMAALGPDFDIAEFHTEILKNGAVPLSVLDGVIATWIEEKS